MSNKAEEGYFESYMAFINPRQEERSFIESYVERRAERRVEEHHKQNKWLDLAVTIVVAVGFILGGIVVLAAQIAWLLLVLVGVIISAFIIGSIFKG